jgi:hypothetical protein
MKYYFIFILAILSLNLGAQSATCEETNETGREDIYPVITKTCKFGNIRTVSTSTAEYTGRYDTNYQLFFNEKAVNTSEIFNKKQEQLIKIINQKFEVEFEKMRIDKTNKDCLDGRTFKSKKMNDLAIDFDDDKIKFICDFHLGLRCGTLNDGVVTLKITEVKKYLKD